MVNNIIKAKKQALELHSFVLKIEIILWVNIFTKLTSKTQKTNPMNIELSLYCLVWTGTCPLGGIKRKFTKIENEPS